MRLSVRLFSLLGALSMVPVTVLGIATYRAWERSHLDAAYSNLHVLAAHKQARFEQWVDENLDAVLELAARPTLRTYVSGLVGFRAKRVESDYLQQTIRSEHLLPVKQLDHDVRSCFCSTRKPGKNW